MEMFLHNTINPSHLTPCCSFSWKENINVFQDMLIVKHAKVLNLIENHTAVKKHLS